MSCAVVLLEEADTHCASSQRSVRKKFTLCAFFFCDKSVCALNECADVNLKLFQDNFGTDYHYLSWLIKLCRRVLI